MAARQLRIVGPFRCCPRRGCASRNANERRASLEKDDAQADPMNLSGKADTAAGMSETIRPAGCRGSGDSMYTRKARATREAQLPVARTVGSHVLKRKTAYTSTRID